MKQYFCKLMKKYDWHSKIVFDMIPLYFKKVYFVKNQGKVNVSCVRKNDIFCPFEPNISKPD